MLKNCTFTPIFLKISRIIGGVETADRELVQGELSRLIGIYRDTRSIMFPSGPLDIYTGWHPFRAIQFLLKRKLGQLGSVIMFPFSPLTTGGL
jgi:hypothetical protein